MNINNRKIAATYRIVAAFIGVITIFVQLGVFNVDKKIENMLYFTTISNFLCTIMFIVLSIKTLIDIKKYGTFGYTSISSHLKGEITISIILTMSVYHFILIPFGLKEDPTRRLELIDIILHYIVPCITIFDWLLFDRKRRFKIYDPLLWTILPSLYIIFIYIQGNFNLSQNLNIGMGKYIYSFLDYNLLGKQAVGENIVIISIIFLIIGYVMCGIDSIRIQNDEKNLKKI